MKTHHDGHNKAFKAVQKTPAHYVVVDKFAQGIDKSLPKRDGLVATQAIMAFDSGVLVYFGDKRSDSLM